MPYASRDGCRLYYEITGAGPPVLFVAGLGGMATYWRAQIEAFASRHTVILCDQRGSGRSDHVAVRSVEEMAADAIAVLDAVGIDRVHYVGHSTGGAIGQSLAIDYPGRLLSLVVYSSTVGSDPYRRKVFEIRRALHERLGAEFYAKQTSLLLYPSWWINENSERIAAQEAASAATLAPPNVQASRLDAILAFDRSAELRRIATPTLVLCAEDDILTPIYFSERIAQAIPGAKFIRFPRGGHALSTTMADAFNDLVLDFIASCR